MPTGYKQLYSKTRGSSGGRKGGVHGSNTGRYMGAPKMGAMQTPARLASTRKQSGRRR